MVHDQLVGTITLKRCRHAYTQEDLRTAHELGLRAALSDSALAAGVNTLGGNVTCQPVAQAHGLPYVELASLTI